MLSVLVGVNKITGPYPNVLDSSRTIKFQFDTRMKLSKCKIVAAMELNEKEDTYVPLNSKRTCLVPKEIIESDRKFFRLKLIIANDTSKIETNQIIVMKEV